MWDTADSPEREDSARYFARSVSQSQRRIWFILRAQGANGKDGFHLSNAKRNSRQNQMNQ